MSSQQKKRKLQESREDEDDEKEQSKRYKPDAQTQEEKDEQHAGRKLSVEQKQCLDLVLKQRRNVFLTGCAGAGKSFVIECLLKEAVRRKLKVSLTASTGIAAANISGTTLHAWMGLGLAEGPVADLIARARKIPSIRERWTSVDILVIDEISMLEPRLLGVLHHLACYFRRQTNRPFGGITMLFSGDFAQLPPVSCSSSSSSSFSSSSSSSHSHSNSNNSVSVLSNNNKQPHQQQVTEFCFEHPLWKSARIVTVCLTLIYRQSDPNFQSLLRRVRLHQETAEDLRVLQSKVGPRSTADHPCVKYVMGLLYGNRDLARLVNSYCRSQPPYVQLLQMETAFDPVEDVFEIVDTELYPTNRDVDAINLVEMQRIQPNPKLYVEYICSEVREGQNTGNIKLFDSFLKGMKQHCLSKPEIRLCTGAQVMLVANINVKAKLVNGARGVVVGFSSPTVVAGLPPLRYPRVRFSHGVIETIQPHTWKYESPSASSSASYPTSPTRAAFAAYIQIPLKLCWSVTIHKSQGLTLDRVHLKLDKQIFTAGQAYCGLSRVTSLDGLSLETFHPSSIVAHPKVIAFYGDASLQKPKEMSDI